MIDSSDNTMQIYLVGGAVRDGLLNRPIIERDWVVTGARPQMLLEKGFTQVGKDFPVFLHPKTREEYALARLERKSGQGYTGFTCDASPSVTLEDDLLRRDLTINAMAQDESGKIIDPFNGQDDLNKRLLRHVSAAFSEDPLRVLRVARFAARYHYLGFELAPDTANLMRQMAGKGMLKELTAERVWQETRRALMEVNPAVFFTTLDKTDALNAWFSPFAPFAVKYQQALQYAADHDASLLCRIGVLSSFVNSDDAHNFCTTLKCPNDVTAVCQLSARFTYPLIEKTDAATLLATFNQCDVWRRPERFATLLQVCQIRADVQKQNWSKTHIECALEAALKVDIQQIIAKGHKGPAIKAALNSAREDAIREKLTF